MKNHWEAFFDGMLTGVLIMTLAFGIGFGLTYGALEAFKLFMVNNLCH